MLRRDVLQSAVGAMFVAAVSKPARAEESKIMTTSVGQSASVNGMNLYFERQGSVAPLVLLHGGLGTIEEIFGGPMVSDGGWHFAPTSWPVAFAAVVTCGGLNQPGLTLWCFPQPTDRERSWRGHEAEQRRRLFGCSRRLDDHGGDQHHLRLRRRLRPCPQPS